MGSSNNSPVEPPLPFPIFMISTKVERYLLYDIDTVTWLRNTHNILGVLIGTLPQFPQQNVFLGLPLELQPEEACFLVEEKIAYVVDDFRRHDKEICAMTPAQKEALAIDLHKKAKAAAMLYDKKKDASKEKTMKRLRDENRVPKKEPLDPSPEAIPEGDREESLFSVPLQSNLQSIQSSSPSRSSISESPNQESWAITPSTSSLPLPKPTNETLPTVRPSSYALFKHLHNSSYFLSPGLRFGCQFLVYPGDPLRFHSHFLAVAMDWDEEIDLLDLIGGGRLGTGVKKGWMIGGAEEGGVWGARAAGGKMDSGSEVSDAVRDEIEEPVVRTFCIEWGGM